MKLYNRITLDTGLTVSALISVYYLRLPKSYSGMRERHPFAQLVYLDSGTLEYTVDEQSRTLSAGQLMIIPPGVTRRARSTSATRGNIGIISFDCGAPELCALSDAGVIDPDESEVALLRELLSAGGAALEPIYGDELYKGMRPREGVGPAFLALFAARLGLLLASLRFHVSGETMPAPAGPRDDAALLAELKEFMTRRVCSGVTVDELCRTFSLSASRLKQLFRDNEGCGAIDYFIRLKIERAKALVRDTDLTFTQIAERLGFCSVHYFSRVFRTRCGFTPSAYRAGGRGAGERENALSEESCAKT